MNQVNPYVYSREMQFLDKNFTDTKLRANIDAQILADYDAGKLRIREKHHYFRKKLLSQSGNLEVMLLTDDKVQGKTSIDKRKLPKGVVYCVGMIALSYSQNATPGNTDPGGQLFSRSVYNPQNYAAGTVDLDAGGTGNQFAPVEAQLVPTGLLNAEYQIFVGETLVKEGLIGDLFIQNKFDLGPNSSDLAGNSLLVPIIIPGEKDILFNIKYPDGVNIGNTVAHFLGIDFWGLEAGART